jgi:hypothetical protein
MTTTLDILKRARARVAEGKRLIDAMDKDQEANSKAWWHALRLLAQIIRPKLPAIITQEHVVAVVDKAIEEEEKRL